MAEWIDVATEQLSRLENPHREKKRATIIALVDARLAGATEESVWTQPQCCSRNTYHSKWKKDPVFADVLDKVYHMARDWNDGRSVRALAEAAERLALASPAAVSRIIQRLNSEDESIILRAAFGILDRAGVETATKVDMRQEVKHELDGDTAASVFDILAAAGALQPGADAGEDDEVHPAQADT